VLLPPIALAIYGAGYTLNLVRGLRSGGGPDRG